MISSFLDRLDNCPISQISTCVGPGDKLSRFCVANTARDGTFVWGGGGGRGCRKSKRRSQLVDVKVYCRAQKMSQPMREGGNVFFFKNDFLAILCALPLRRTARKTRNKKIPTFRKGTVVQRDHKLRKLDWWSDLKLFVVLRKKGSKTKKRMKEEEIEKGDCGPSTRKVRLTRLTLVCEVRLGTAWFKSDKISKKDFSGWRPAIAFVYLFLFHSLLRLTSFFSQYKNENFLWATG